MSLNQKQLGAFHRDGYIIVEDLYDPEEVNSALAIYGGDVLREVLRGISGGF